MLNRAFTVWSSLFYSKLDFARLNLEIKGDTFLFSALAIERAILVLPTPKREKHPVLYGKKLSQKETSASWKKYNIFGSNFRESAKMGNFGGIHFHELGFLSSSFCNVYNIPQLFNASSRKKKHKFLSAKVSSLK